MRTIALEEHFTTAEFLQATGRLSECSLYWQATRARLLDLGEGRIADMNANGIDLQVLSLITGGLDRLDATTAMALAGDANDQAAAAVRAYPNRFAGFANLALQEPDKAAVELERCVRQLGFKGAMVNGTTNGAFLDDP